MNHKGCNRPVKRVKGTYCETCGIRLNGLPNCRTGKVMFRKRFLCQYCFELWSKDIEKFGRETTWLEFTTGRIAK